MNKLIDDFLTPGTNRGIYYGGMFQKPSHDAVIEVLNPATAQVFSTVPDATATDVQAAVAAARSAFGGWSDLDPLDRSRHLHAFADILRANMTSLALLESTITGRSIREMNAQMARIPEWLEYFASIAIGLEGESNVVKGGYVTMTHYEPLGPVALLTPWNHPILILVKKLAAALAAGNTCVIKPSELAPVSSLVLAALATEAGLPDGVVNVVTGGPATGAALCAADDIHYIDLTGGTATGRKVASLAGERLIRTTMELGGKTPIIVCQDADIEGAIAGTLFSAFVASGQTCVSGARFLVHDKIYDRFVAGIAARAEQITIGDPMDEATQMGPVISQKSKDRCMSMIAQAKADGAKMVAGAGPLGLSGPFVNGFYVRPTVFKDVEPHHELFLEEVFGPVISITRFQDDAEAMEMANTGTFGLGVSIWSRDIARAHRLSLKVRGGVVWLNDHHRNDPRSVWGGVRDSGFGKENGWDALRAYLTKKSVIVRTSEGHDDWFKGSGRYG
jgi:acyl-CoA reductase-like NAD-dependent aldehyde dehydrogenase|tara:strand:+ start:4002 stop:5516 length:1515 start_codon:yes stop_codon:yes gene_type:complete